MIIPVITYEVKPVVLKPWPKIEKIKPVKKSQIFEKIVKLCLD